MKFNFRSGKSCFQFKKNGCVHPRKYYDYYVYIILLLFHPQICANSSSHGDKNTPSHTFHTIPILFHPKWGLLLSIVGTVSMRGRLESLKRLNSKVMLSLHLTRESSHLRESSKSICMGQVMLGLEL
jgi:hypothetical protein